MENSVKLAVEQMIIRMNVHMIRHYDSLTTHSVEFRSSQKEFNEYKLDERRKYYCIVSHGGIVAFIDKVSGDVFKPASWKAPAKGVRGNVLDATGGESALHYLANSGLVFVNYAR